MELAQSLLVPFVDADPWHFRLELGSLGQLNDLPGSRRDLLGAELLHLEKRVITVSSSYNIGTVLAWPRPEVLLIILLETGRSAAKRHITRVP